MMDPFTTITGVAAPMPLANIDTDMIAPGEAMHTVAKEGLGPHLFARMRYRADGSENPDFVLNRPAYRRASILVARENFGCGSSREHAVWALKDFGIRCIIAPSFADIFFVNALRNGILLITMPSAMVDLLLEDAAKGANAVFTVDLKSQVLVRPDGEAVPFEVDPFRKDCLIAGRTDAERIASMREQLNRFEAWQRAARPWLWFSPPSR